MSRKSGLIFFIFVLLLSIGIVLFFQWNKFSSKQEQEHHVVQTITIQHLNKQFIVKQTFQSLASGAYKIAWPTDAKNIKCYDEKNRECQWLNSKRTNLKVIKGPITVQFELNRTGSGSSLLLEDWYAKMDNVRISSSKVQLSEKQFKTGAWLAGSKNITVKRMKYVDYYVFESNGQAHSLLWLKDKLKRTKINTWLTFYHQKSMKVPTIDLSRLGEIKNPPNLAVVITDQYPNISSKSLITINNNPDKAGLEEQVIREVTDQVFSFRNDEKWLMEVINSVMLNKAVGSNKAKAMYNELTVTIGKENVNKWIEKVLDLDDTTLSSKKLDAIVEDTIGLGTDFFTRNHQSNTPLKNLVLFDPRKIIVTGKERKDLHLITRKGKSVLKLEDIADALGYKVKVNNHNHTIEIKNAKHQFLFFIEQNIFIHNGEKYGLLSSPFIKMDDDYFIELNWLKQLLNTKIIENEHSIEMIK